MSVCIFVAVDCPYNITFCFIVISLPYSMANKKSRRIHLSQGVKSAGLFVFSEIVKYTRRSRLVYTQATKTRGIQRGAPLWLWVSNRGEQHPCWHTTLLAKYSVLYLCFRLTPGRDWLRYLLCGQIAVDKHFSAAVGQADFVRSRTKSGFAHRAKSAWPEKEAEVYKSSRPGAAAESSSVRFPLGFLTVLIDIILVLAPWAAKGGVGPAAQKHLLAMFA